MFLELPLTSHTERIAKIFVAVEKEYGIQEAIDANNMIYNLIDKAGQLIYGPDENAREKLNHAAGFPPLQKFESIP